MSFWTAVVLMVALVAGARVLRARYEAQGTAPRIINNGDGEGDTRRLRADVQALKDRIAVLERLATDRNSSDSFNLDLEIEKLRDGR